MKKHFHSGKNGRLLPAKMGKTISFWKKPIPVRRSRMKHFRKIKPPCHGSDHTGQAFGTRSLGFGLPDPCPKIVLMRFWQAVKMGEGRRLIRQAIQQIFRWLYGRIHLQLYLY